MNLPCAFFVGVWKRGVTVEERMVKRLSRESIASYIQFGGESVKFDTKSFDEKVKDCDVEIKKLVTELGLMDEQIDKLLSNVSLLAEIHLDEGIKLGVNLLLNLMK